MRTRWHYLAAVTSLVITLVTSNPDGVPETACVDMKPGAITGVVGLEGHLTGSQNLVPTYGNSKVPPYYMTVSSAEYAPGQEITVNIVANQTTGMVMYKGILLQARRVICASDLGHDNQTILVEDAAIGTFMTYTSTQLLKTMACGGTANTAVCHRSPQFKINESATWIAPTPTTGHLVFRATISQDSSIYWTHVHSQILLDPTSVEAAPRTCDSTRPMVHSLMAVFLLATLLLLNS